MQVSLGIKKNFGNQAKLSKKNLASVYPYPIFNWDYIYLF